jgi:hypothetical protein
VGWNVEYKRGWPRMTSALRTFSIGEIEKIHARMGYPIAADVADIRTPVGRKMPVGMGARICGR